MPVLSVVFPIIWPFKYSSHQNLVGSAEVKIMFPEVLAILNVIPFKAIYFFDTTHLVSPRAENLFISSMIFS